MRFVEVPHFDFEFDGLKERLAYSYPIVVELQGLFEKDIGLPLITS